MIILLERRPVV